MISYLVITPILFPVLFAIFIPFLHFKNRGERERYIGFFVLLNSLLTYWFLFHRPEDAVTFIYFTKNLSLSLKIDGLSCIFAALVAMLWPLASVFAFEYMKHEKRENYFFTFYTATYGITLGIAFSANLMTLYMFYELLTLITLPLVMHTMDPKSIRAGMKYLFYSIGGAAFAFIGFIFILTYGTSTNFILGGVLDLERIGSQKNLLLFIYVLAFLGFGVKAAIFPFHGWLPSASIAPTPVTALLHAVAVVKAGAFAIIRITYYSFGTDFIRESWAQYIVMGFAIITILYGSTMAIKETHLKRRLAYSTISNLSYIIFSITIMTPAGLVGGLTHLVFHGVMKICLFFSAGAIMYQTKKEYISEMVGFGKKMPRVFLCFTISSLALVGVPPLMGFITKINLFGAIASSNNILAYIGGMILIVSTLLTAIYLLTIVIRAFFPPNNWKIETTSNIKDPNWYMKLPLYLFSVAIIVFGIYSTPFIQIFWNIANGLF